jgi:hypothetical protein
VELRETDYDLDVGELKIHYVKERRFHNWPHLKIHDGGQPITAVVDSGSEAKIFTQEMFKILAASNTEISQIHVTGAFLISAWSNRTKKIKTQALLPFEISGGYFERISMIAPGMIADCILGPDFLDEFQVIDSFKDHCMYTKDENGSRRQQFVSEEMGSLN